MSIIAKQIRNYETREVKSWELTGEGFTTVLPINLVNLIRTLGVHGRLLNGESDHVRKLRQSIAPTKVLMVKMVREASSVSLGLKMSKDITDFLLGYDEQWPSRDFHANKIADQNGCISLAEEERGWKPGELVVVKIGRTRLQNPEPRDFI